MPQPRSQNRLLHVTTVPMTLRFLRGQIGFMKRQGLDIEIVSSPGQELDDFGREEGVKVHPVSMERRMAPGKDLVSLYWLWSTMRHIQPDIVHSHTPKGGLLGMLAATLAGVPTRCYHLRGLPMMSARGPKRELLRWTERLSCTLANEVFAVSHSLRDVALEEGLCPSHKIRVLAGGSGNGVDSEGQYNPTTHGAGARTAKRLELGIPDDAAVIGFVGRLVRDKGLVELHEAWQAIRARYPDCYLLLVGPREQADAVPERVLRSFDRDERVRQVGMVPSAAPYYPTMDLVVLPTYREGFPNVPLEAAAMALPVVTTRVPGCVDAVEDGVTGALVEVRSAAALVRGIAPYLDSEALRREHGTRGRERVVTDFSQETIWRALYHAYEGLLARHRVSRSAGTEGVPCVA